MMKHKTIIGQLDAGWETPQLQIQITPLQWGFGFVICFSGKAITKMGCRVGPVAVAVYLRSRKFGTHRIYQSVTHATSS